MNALTPLGWMAEQRRHGLSICLVLDPGKEPEALRALHAQLPPERWRCVYSNTAAAELAAVGPILFLLEDAEINVLNDLLATPQRNWGWLAALPAQGLAAWTEHWRQRLVVGQWPQQLLYRFHDNAVLSRALAHLPATALPGYLGLASSVCYWQGQAWAVAVNPAPAPMAAPKARAWLDLPAPSTQTVRFENAHNYLLDQHLDTYDALAKSRDPLVWLHEQLARAAQWGWERSELMEFFLVQSLSAIGYVLPAEWDPLPGEDPDKHLRRLQVEAMLWAPGRLV